MALYGKEKIWFLIDRIKDARELTPKGELVGVHRNDLLHKYSLDELLDIFTILEKKKRAVSLKSLPTDPTFNRYMIKLLAGFDKFVKRIEADPDYQEKWPGNYS